MCIRNTTLCVIPKDLVLSLMRTNIVAFQNFARSSISTRITLFLRALAVKSLTRSSVAKSRRASKSTPLKQEWECKKESGELFRFQQKKESYSGRKSLVFLFQKLWLFQIFFFWLDLWWRFPNAALLYLMRSALVFFFLKFYEFKDGNYDRVS